MNEKLDWPVTRNVMTAIWRRRNVIYGMVYKFLMVIMFHACRY